MKQFFNAELVKSTIDRHDELHLLSRTVMDKPSEENLERLLLVAMDMWLDDILSTESYMLIINKVVRMRDPDFSRTKRRRR